MALNDGEGTFETVRTEEIGDAFLNVLTGDVTGDGQDEIALSLSSEVEVWSMGAGLQMEVLAQMSRRNLESMTDWDNDGDVELFLIDLNEIEYSKGFPVGGEAYLEVWDVENGVWTAFSFC